MEHRLVELSSKFTYRFTNRNLLSIRMSFGVFCFLFDIKVPLSQHILCLKLLYTESILNTNVSVTKFVSYD